MIRSISLIILFPLLLLAQVKVNINSGDPAYPFPQFQPYTTPNATYGNVGTNNPCGVPHAEMEKTIRDAYQIMMNATTKPGGGVGGIDYVYYKSNPSCSEGDGYGMLGAVSMCDKTTFDGLWLWIHDNAMNKVKRYSDCKESSPGYAYSQLPGWTNKAGQNSATDGDVDIGLALLLAYRQWGEFMGIKDACGNPISYKQAAIDFLKGLTDTLTYAASGSLLSGDIGIDGYFKGGDSWGELSGWATAANTPKIGISKRVEQPGPTKQYFDYTAPAYFRQFADFLAEEDSATYAWNIMQFRRAEASSDWLIGKMYQANPKNIPISGDVQLKDTTPTFAFTGNMGEDFRLGWRTIMTCIWNGNPTYTWNPSTHMIEVGKTNTYEIDMGKRYGKFLWDSRQSPWNHSCVPSVGTDPFDHWGPMTLITNTGIDGTVPADGFYFLNWLPAVGSPSAIVAQNYDCMNELYRYLDIEWDVAVPGDGYLTSEPVYYHGWYRMLGLLLLTGNYPSPAVVKPAANMKVYLALDKTFAFEKDTLTYTIDYRNYGSKDAQGTLIVDTLHKDFQFVSATGGGVYNNTAHTVSWNIGKLPGFKTATGIAPTVGQVQLKVLIRTATQKQYRNKVHVSCTNGTGWVSNDYPNNLTAIMMRNHLDIARRALILDHKAQKSIVKPGETVEFSIDFENSSDAGWINGGRPGVSFSFSQSADGGGTATMNTMRTRLYHDAAESYIDFGNYRISYFLYDDTYKCIANVDGCATGWAFSQTITEGLKKADVKLVHEMIVPGQDERGKWNQRLIVQFSDPLDTKRVESLTTIDRHVSGYRGIAGRIHRGGTEPLRLVWFFNASDWKPVDWTNAWSWNPNISEGDAGNYFPVTNDWSDPDAPNIPVDHWNRKACAKATKTVDNILVEEWDGYTWRRVAGNGPMPGREARNVVIRDTVPEGFTFVNFTGDNPLGVAPSITGKVITWTVPRMQIKEGGTIKFLAKATGSCPGTPDRDVVNRAWISADKESPFADSTMFTISCDTVIKPPPPDHIDIVLDTTLIDMNNDADFVRLDLDEGTQVVTAYAVVRDRNGKFIRKVTGAVWESRDTRAVTAAAASAVSWQGIITKGNGGTTVVTVSEPGNPDIKPDSLAINAIPTPPWPALSMAIMEDLNGDVIPDYMTITLNDTFHVNQLLDSIIIDYNGTKLRYPASAVVLQQKTIVLQIPGLTAADPEPKGTVTMVINVDGAEKRSTREITDGIDPVITKVTLAQGVTSTTDTLNLTFSEDVSMQTLLGSTLQLIKPATNDTITLTVVAFKGPELFGETRITAISTNGVRPQETDLIRLVPGDKGGTVTDRKKNLPHNLNQAVMIPETPSQLAGAKYVDENADGIIDAVYLQFVKKVQTASLAVSISWGNEEISKISGALLSYLTDQTLVRVALPQSTMAKNGLKTDGNMFCQVTFTDAIGYERSTKVQDAAAPVIDIAVFKLGAASAIGQEAIDSLIITFSEKVQVAPDNKNPFLLSSVLSGIGYTFNLTPYSSKDKVVLFVVDQITGVSYPESGDLISISPNSAIRDSLTWQNNAVNRKAALSLQKGALKWDVVVAPNPFEPQVAAGAATGTGTELRVINPLNPLIPINISDATVTIYDATGNVVLNAKPFVKGPTGPVYYWNGTNAKGRFVGRGTYIGVVHVNDKGTEGALKVKIGVGKSLGGVK